MAKMSAGMSIIEGYKMIKLDRLIRGTDVGTDE